MHEQQTIRSLKFIGYVGVSIASLMIPLFIFKISGNAAAAGICMLFEWFPKIVVYLLGGGIAKRVGALMLYRRIEVARALAMLALLLAAGPLPLLWLVVLASSVIQSSNAISNILFESLVNVWWDNTEKSKGYSLLIRGDLMAGILVVPAIAWLPAYAILMIGVFAFSCNVGASFLLKKHLFDNLKLSCKEDSSLYWIYKNAVAGIKDVLNHPSLIKLTLLTLAVTLPGAMVITQLPFFLKRTDFVLAGSAIFLALFSAARAICSILALKWSSWMIHHGTASARLMLVGIGLNVVGPLLIVWGPLLWYQCAGAVMMSSGFFMYTIFSREKRQQLISQHEDPLTLTGLLTAVEAIAYLMGGVLLWIFSTHLEVTLSVCAMIIPLVTVYVWDKIR